MSVYFLCDNPKTLCLPLSLLSVPSTFSPRRGRRRQDFVSLVPQNPLKSHDPRSHLRVLSGTKLRFRYSSLEEGSLQTTQGGRQRSRQEGVTFDNRKGQFCKDYLFTYVVEGLGFVQSFVGILDETRFLAVPGGSWLGDRVSVTTKTNLRTYSLTSPTAVGLSHFIIKIIIYLSTTPHN